MRTWTMRKAGCKMYGTHEVVEPIPGSEAERIIYQGDEKTAALIAAAPELLALCEAAEFWLSESKPGDGVTPDEMLRELRAALAKAPSGE